MNKKIEKKRVKKIEKKIGIEKKSLDFIKVP